MIIFLHIKYYLSINKMNGKLNINREQIKTINNDIKSEGYKKSSPKIIINNQINQKYNNKDSIIKNITPLPAYKNLLDNYNIIQYKYIIMQRIKFDTNNEYNLDYYKNIFDDFFKKINNDYVLRQNFINSKSKLLDNKKSKNNKYENLTFDNKIKNQSFSIISNEKNIINFKSNSSNISNISDNEINSIFSFGDNKINLGDTVISNDEIGNDMVQKSKYKRAIFNIQLFDKNNNLIHKKRGRLSEKKDILHVHSALDDDNILRKIQVHFLSFLVSFTNDYLNTLFSNVDKNKIIHFLHIDYKYKRTINHRSIEKIKSLTIGQLLQLEISQKYKKFNKNLNEIIYNKICTLCPKIKDNYFNMLFKKFFIEYYYNKNDGFIFINGIKVILSDKTRAFNNLIQKNIENSKKFREIATYFFLNNIKRDGNDTNKNDDEKVEDQKEPGKKTFFLIE